MTVQISSVNQENFDLTISDPAGLLTEIAKRYQNTTRVLMEYIDNSLDDAEVLFQDNSKSYPYPIKIQLAIDRKLGTVSIKDNCRGMDRATLIRIVKNVGESQKKGVPWLNGQFGFGVHAFRAAADRITFHTKSPSDKHWKMSFTRSESKNLTPPDEVLISFPSDSGTGTEVIISEFIDEWYDELSVETIKAEIEKHFERLLNRPGLSITVQEVAGPVISCTPFDYGLVPGRDFSRTLPITLGKKSYEVKASLKITDTLVRDRKATFFARGRRINEIQEIKSFINRSKYRTAVWGHDNLIGYIEFDELVEPVITRDDFQRGRGRKLLYDEILKFEEDLKKALDEVNKRYESHSMGRLEQVLSAVLAKLAREDALRFRTDAVTSGKEALETGGGSAIQPDSGGPSGFEGGEGGDGGSGEGTGQGPSGEGEGALPGYGSGGPQPSVSPLATGYTGRARRKSGFDVQFVSLPTDAEGKVIRSRFLEGTIAINVDHPDFKERIERTRQGEPKVTHRLIAYLAGVISIHYKDQFYHKYGKQPEARTDLFDQQVEFICKLESTLTPYMKELSQMMSEDGQTSMFES